MTGIAAWVAVLPDSRDLLNSPLSTDFTKNDGPSSASLSKVTLSMYAASD